MAESQGNTFKIIISFAIVYIVWGSTYLANEYAIDFMPPRLMAGTRFIVAGAALLLFVRLYKWEKTTWLHWRNATVIGILLITVAVGSTVWAQQYVDSGLTSLLAGMNPAIVVFLMWGLLNVKPKRMAIAGVVIGLIGLYLLVNQDVVLSGEKSILGILMILVATTSWGLGSVIINRLELPKSKFQSSGMQMLTGGILLTLLGWISNEGLALNIGEIPLVSWFAWGYLILFGSIATFTAFNYLLEHVSTEKVATTAYVNPVIAVFLGWFFRDEPLTLQTLIAASLMIFGVYFINASK